MRRETEAGSVNPGLGGDLPLPQEWNLSFLLPFPTAGVFISTPKLQFSLPFPTGEKGCCYLEEEGDTQVEFEQWLLFSPSQHHWCFVKTLSNLLWPGGARGGITCKRCKPPSVSQLLMPTHTWSLNISSCIILLTYMALSGFCPKWVNIQIVSSWRSPSSRFPVSCLSNYICSLMGLGKVMVCIFLF